MYGDTEIWEEELAIIEKTWKDYVVIEKMRSNEAYEVMESFANGIADKEINRRLEYSLNGRKPFSSFKNEVDYNDDIRAQWFIHKDAEYIKYVRYHLEDDFELPEISEDKSRQQKGGINLDGKTLLLVENSANGEVDSRTTFEFIQEGKLVTADYNGGQIIHGNIIGKLENDELEMVYQCMTKSSRLRSGAAVGRLELNQDGKIKMAVVWKWLDEDGVAGSSTYVEE